MIIFFATFQVNPFVFREVADNINFVVESILTFKNICVKVNVVYFAAIPPLKK